MSFRAVNPVDGSVLGAYPRTPAADVPGLLLAAAEAQASWAGTEFEARGEVLKDAAELLRRHAPALALLMADEMGKPVAQGKAETHKCAEAFDHFARHAARYLAPDLITGSKPRREVRYVPRGLVLGVMPWNFPLWQIVRLAAPALMAGNGCLIKPAPSTPGCALALASLLKQAGLPEGLFTNLLIPEQEVHDLIADARVRFVSVTGGTDAGRAIARTAGEHITPSLLELGGSDAYLVLSDADLEDALRDCASSRFVNNGQSCIAAKRWIVVDAVRPAFTEAAREMLSHIQVGPPRDPETQVGPLARVDLRDALHAQVVASRVRGANVLLGGEKPEGPGAYYPVTLVTDVVRGMPLYDEEVFGPVAVILEAANETEAIRIANDSPFGLGAAVFTKDPERGRRVANQLDAGNIAINTVVHSDARVPFGGVKRSGYGRELGGPGIRALCVTKSFTTA